MDIRNSELLSDIFECAETMRRENDCSAMTRDMIVLAAIQVVDGRENEPAGDDDEYAETKKLLGRYSRQSALRDGVLDKWRHKKVPSVEQMILSTQKGKALNTAKLAQKDRLTANMLLAEILREETPAMLSLRRDEQTPAPGMTHADDEAGGEIIEEAHDKESAKTVIAHIQRDIDAILHREQTPQTPQKASAEPMSMSVIIRNAKQLQSALQETVFGQQHAVSLFASGYFRAELQANIEKDRKRPRATFLFAGPPGVGKTFLSEEAARVLALPFCRYDMSEYTGPNATDELSGSDANYKASAEGLLTGFVSKNPKCVLLFDEIEKASTDVIHLFLQVLDAGRLRDNRTDKEVSFKDTILIFTTNAGRALYENDDAGKLSALSRDVILDALSDDVNPQTKEPYFPASVCSRFASGNVIMFNRLGADSLLQIISRELTRHAENLKAAMDITVHTDEDIASALLYAEGAQADARTVKSRADAFIGGELYELFRLLPSGGDDDAAGKIRDIHFSVNRRGEPESVTRLFEPKERVCALAYAEQPFAFDTNDVRVPVLHYVQTLEQAKQVMHQENIRLVFCDVLCGEKRDSDRYLNLEDRDSAARDFLNGILRQYPALPVVLTETDEQPLTEEEKISYLRSGVSGFLSMRDEDLTRRVGRYTQSIYQQSAMTELARSNRLIRYETAQCVSPDGCCADILLFDMKLERAVRADDADNVLSMLSTPDVRFDDVIGAEEAKKELGFFVTYMQQPKRFRRQGVSAPKGVLLYGPPGTGKTMLAKAFAAESGATFIATQGNQFYKGIVGQGAAMVHRLFATARRYAPSVIFIDEIDTVARARSGRDTDLAQDNEQILTALFAEMDGFSTAPDKPVFVLGATNYGVEPGAKMALDAAMLRRFDRRILVDVPNLENRRAFLQRQNEQKDILLLTPEGIASLADRSCGMSLAQLSSVVDLAIRTAMQRQAEHVDDGMLEEAFDTYNSGEAKKWNAETTLRTARHEAGHALIAWLAGEKPSYVTIVSRADFGGYMQYADREERMGYTRQELLSRIRTALGGRAAETVYYGAEDGLSTGASSDLSVATGLARQMLCRYGMDDAFGPAVVDDPTDSVACAVHAGVNALLRRELADAVAQIMQNRDKIDALTARLLERSSLRAQEIEQTLGGAET